MSYHCKGLTSMVKWKRGERYFIQIRNQNSLGRVMQRNDHIFSFTDWVKKNTQEPWGLRCSKEEDSNWDPFLGLTKIMGEEERWRKTAQTPRGFMMNWKGVLLLSSQTPRLDWVVIRKHRFRTEILNNNLVEKGSKATCEFPLSARHTLATSWSYDADSFIDCIKCGEKSQSWCCHFLAVDLEEIIHFSEPCFHVTHS